jgi:small subunit ribosomal protein S20
MPQKLAAKRYLRKSDKKHLRNIERTGKVKQAVKKFQSALTAKNTTESKTSLQQLHAIIDKAASKKLIHRNKAARQKSRTAKALNKLNVKA